MRRSSLLQPLFSAAKQTKGTRLLPKIPKFDSEWSGTLHWKSSNEKTILGRRPTRPLSSSADGPPNYDMKMQSPATLDGLENPSRVAPVDRGTRRGSLGRCADVIVLRQAAHPIGCTPLTNALPSVADSADLLPLKPSPRISWPDPSCQSRRLPSQRYGTKGRAQRDKLFAQPSTAAATATSP